MYSLGKLQCAIHYTSHFSHSQSYFIKCVTYFKQYNLFSEVEHGISHGPWAEFRRLLAGSVNVSDKGELYFVPNSIFKHL